MVQNIQSFFSARRTALTEPLTPETIRSAYGAQVWPTPLFTESIRTWANGITIFRTVVCLAMFCYAIITGSPEWNLASLIVHGALDIADGFVARALRQETTIGAQLDIFADRLLISFFYITYLMFHPEMAVVIALFLFQFNFLDLYLSNQFVRMPLRSPNYFFVIDPIIWRISWSREGKFFNTALITLVLIFGGIIWLALAIILLQIAGKLYAIARLHRIELPKL